MSRKEGGRGLISLQDSEDISIQEAKDYIKKNKNRSIIMTRNSTDNIKINRTITKKQKWREKQLYGYFKLQTGKISHEKTWTWIRKGNLRRKAESLLIAAQNNTIRTNYVKAKTDNMQQNSKCRLCGDIYPSHDKQMLQTKEYTTRHDWVGKVIHWELCKKSKFDHTNKWYMH